MFLFFIIKFCNFKVCFARYFKMFLKSRLYYLMFQYLIDDILKYIQLNKSYIFIIIIISITNSFDWIDFCGEYSIVKMGCNL